MTENNALDSNSRNLGTGEGPATTSSMNSVVGGEEEHLARAGATPINSGSGAAGSTNDGTGGDGGEKGEESGSGSEQFEEVAGDLVHAQRRSKTRAERAMRKGGKAGNQGRFQPAIEEFLNDYVDVYAAAHKSAGGRAKGLDEFWHLIRSEFWAKFNWKDARVGMVSNGEGLKQEEVMTKTNEVSLSCGRLRSKDSRISVVENLVSMASPQSFHDCQ